MARKVTPEQFAAELLLSAVRVVPAAAMVVKKGVQNIKTQARENVQRTAPTHHAYAHNAITYDDPSILGTRVGAEVGYDKDLPGGDLGNLLEFGGKGDKSPAHRDIGRATDDEEPRFADAIWKLSDKLL
jgi:hypothetical protein